MKTTAIAFTLVALTLTTACGKKKDADATSSGKPAEAAKAAAAAPAAKLEYKKVGATGLEDLAHQRLVGKQRLQQLLLVRPLLGELGQPARRAMVEDGEAHQFGIERIR